LKQVKNGPLLMLSNAGGGFNIIASPSGSIQGPWKDYEGNTLDAEWANFRATVVPSDTHSLPPPVYKFGDNGHCIKLGVNSIQTDANGVSLAGQYVTRNAPTGKYHKCDTNEKNAWNCHMADPALLVKDNGQTIIAFRGTKCDSSDKKERIGILHAPSWDGTYTMSAQPIFQDGAPDEPMDGGLEDLFMWLDSEGVHMVVHSQAQDHAHRCAEGYFGAFDKDTTGNSCADRRSTFHHKKKRGATLFSLDGITDWKLSNYELFPGEMYTDDGKTQFLLKQQRPSLLFDSNDNPTHLISGVDYLYDACCDWYAYGSGWSLIQKISTCKAGQVLKAGVCTTCLAADVSPRCTQATSKYGSCVCAQCTGDYFGDDCQRQKNTCAVLESHKRCESGATSQKYFLKPNNELTWGMAECAEMCEKYSTAQGIQGGCCYSFRDATDGQFGGCRLDIGVSAYDGYARQHAVTCR